MSSIVSWWASNKVAANLLMIAIFIAGLVSYVQMERELDPFVEFPGARISVVWQGASPQDIEEQVVVRLEEAVANIDGLDQMWSASSEGVGNLWLIGGNNTDEAAFMADIKREIDSISTIPAAAEQAQINQFQNRNEVMRIALTGDETVTEQELKRQAEKMRREIALLPYVPDVNLFGTRREEVSIEVSEDALRQYGLTLNDVAVAVRGSSINSSAGPVRTEGGDIQLTTRAQADTAEEFEDIVIRQQSNGAIIRVRDVATVIDGFEQVDLLATANGDRTVLINIENGPKMNVVQLANSVKGYMEENADRLPDGMAMTLWNDASAFYMSRMTTIGSNFLVGLLLVLVTLFLFLRPTVAIWVSIGIATAFAGGLAMLPLFDVSFNMLSTFAFLLVIGVIVDDAIIVGEAIHSRTEEGEEDLVAAVNGTTMVIKPVIFAVFTTMIFFAPWMLLSGSTAEFTKSISLVVIWALTFSLIESLLILPAHLSHLKPINPQGRFARFQASIANSIVWFGKKVYRPLMVGALKQRYLTFALFVAAMILSVGLLRTGIVKTAFMPESESDQVAIDVTLPQGTPFERSLEVLEQIQQAERELVEEVNASTEGEGELIENWYTRARGNNILALVKLVPPEVRELGAEDTANRLRELIGDIPDAESLEVSFSNQNNGPPIEYVLNSTSVEALDAATDDLMRKLRSYEGVYNVVNDSQSASDEVQFDLKPGAEALGVTRADVNRQVRQGFFGEEVQRLPRDGEDVRVFVRYPRADRESLDFLRNIRIRTADGRELPLFAVADIRFENGITQILRRERQRAIVVSAEVVTERISEIREDLDESFFEQFRLAHPDVSMGNIGRAQAEAEFVAEIMILILIAIGVAYFLIAVAFKSYWEPALILLAAIPFCFTGAMIGHLIMDVPLGLMSYLGIMAAAGVAVNDNLVLIDYVHRLREKGMDGAQALVTAGVRRFRPILLTSLTTFVGLFPLMLEKSIQAAWLIPIAISLAFGVGFALLVTLFLVPSLYAIGADINRFYSSVWSGRKRQGFAARLDQPIEDGPGIVPAE